MILDQLQQTLAEPHCSSAWHALYSHWQASPDAAGKAQVLATLAATALNDPRAEMLRLSFLRDTQGDPAFGALAARCALAVQPDNPDRLAAFAAFTWGLAITGQSSGQQLIERLQAASVPELVQRLTLHASAAMVPDLAPQLAPRCPQAVNKVAIIAQYLGNRHHTPSVAVVRQCEILVAEGKTVEIFSCQEVQPPDMKRFFGSSCEVVLTPFEASFWQEALPAGIRLHCSDQRFSLATRWRDGLATVAAFDPDVVLVCGLFSPLASALYAVRPSVALNVHAFAPIVRADLWLSSTEGPDPAPSLPPPSPWGAQAGSPQPYFHPFRIRRPDDGPAPTRAQLGIGSRAIVWITLGGRLADEIDNPWAASMVDILAGNPAITWLLVGGEGKLPAALSACPPERIKLFGTQTGMGAWLKLADIFINPPRAGGGFSVAEAMAVGLPVVSLADGDGGDKLGPHAVVSLEDYAKRLNALSCSAALRAEHGQALQHRFSQRLDLARSGPSLVAALEQACTMAHGRLRAATSAA